MLINYKDANGNSIELEVSDEVGTFYLSSVEAEKKNTRRATRADRHTSLESFVYEDKRFFDAGVNLLADFIESEFIKNAMSHLTERQQYLIRKTCLEGWKYTELAALEGVDESAIRHAVNRAKNKIKKILS
ncbi:sigma factor-like helix-turn-helix DNA-binding protein [Anaeroselena agilis]|uniref:Sigma factor-like helix-turn-helix DNA-binding protein n=1 Tax=Anaeroselena agilis TaxID=3063788 RepID=A0ABU3NVT1_9FIRM|nr:sigma factor-like helix-turn-helix DNA-binding protein [Selenomonadales bacterium 4137-cl]